MLLVNLLLLPNVGSAAAVGLGLASDQTNTGSSSSRQEENDVRELQMGKPIERELAGGQHHSYQVTLTSGQFLHALVEPHGVPMTVTLFALDAKPVIKLAVPAGSYEPLFLVAKEQRPYRIEIGSDEGAEAGSYRLRIEELRVATPQDTNLAIAQRTFSDGEQLRKEGSAESRQKAIETYERALALWRAAGNHRGGAETLMALGMVCYDLSENQKALEYFNEALPLFRTVSDRDGEAETLDNIGETYVTLGERQKALDYFNQALPLRRVIGDRDGEAEDLQNIGWAYSSIGENQKALDYFNQSLPLRRAVGNRADEAQTLSNIGGVYDTLGQMQKALNYYNQALEIERIVGDRTREGQTLNNIGVLYAELGDWRKELDYYTQSLTLRRAVGNRVGEAMTMNNIGVIYFTQGENPKALDYYTQALTLSRTIGNRDGEAYSLSCLGSFYRRLGEWQRSLDYYRRALVIDRAVGDRESEGYTLYSIGAVSYRLGDIPTALDYFHHAQEIERAVGNRNSEGRILTYIGQVYGSLGESQKALDYYNQALTLERAVGDRLTEGATLNGIGSVYASLEKKQEALDYFNQALTLERAVGYSLEEGTALKGIGHVYASSGERQKALDYYNQALSLKRAADDRDGEAMTLGSIALVELEAGHLAEALARIEMAIQIIESLRTNVVSEELRASYFSTVQNNYALYIDVLMRLHQQHPGDRYVAKAVEVSEQARARSLLEILAEAQADIRQGVDPALLEREHGLAQLLKGKEAVQIKLLNGKHTEEQATALKKEIADILTQYEELERQIRVASPRYAALTQPRPLGAPEIQQQLDSNTLLLEYALGDEHSYLWAVDPDSLRSFQLPRRSDIETAARRFYELLTAPNRQMKGETEKQRQARLEQAAAQYPQAAQALSKMLLGPAASLLKGKRLVFVADGALQYIPFSALPEPLNGTIANPKLDITTVNQASLVPLVVGHEIIGLPSASALAVLRQETNGRQSAPKIVAVLADPVFDPHDPRVARAVQSSGRRAQHQEQKTGSTRGQYDGETASLSASLVADRLTRSANEVGVGHGGELQFPRLAFSRREAQAIVSAVPSGKGMMAVDFKASLKTATDPKLSQYRIVHFATHGLLNSEHPELSGLVLSLVDQQGRPQDGFLQLQDIYNLNLPVDLVVLSACETGLGKEIRGEGLMGLTRGFMYAGASRVIASLWKVDDVATAELMERLYRDMLTKGLQPAAALRQSQIDMWEQKRWESPYYWAAFVIQGEWR
jgi:CHAT domain-containing protein/tetratricopeptide (TPR) repeat protein